MTVVLAARPDEEAATILLRARALDVRLWHLDYTLPGPNAVRRRLYEQGVSVVSVATTRDALADAVRFGSALRTRTIVVEGDTLLAGEDVEGAADRMVRALHTHLSEGVPLAIRNASEPTGLLDMTVCEWMLDELPRLVLWMDPARALRRHRAGEGPEPRHWIDAFAGRTGGVFVHGLGASGAGGAHPDDDGPGWEDLRGALPTAAPWVLDLDPALSEDAVADALGYVRALGR